ncbi:hypothetical protein BAG01nite_49550 [Brevibacillus agri]|uniref:Uncharacterized protein n=1 Tax=Brevibacillus agri TaxID=51101 RepID=A0ABQ0SYQ0_9BACL|nr:hypothetical protein BAG01nite_49550 [Brevibacillus agri]
MFKKTRGGVDSMEKNHSVVQLTIEEIKKQELIKLLAELIKQYAQQKQNK